MSKVCWPSAVQEGRSRKLRCTTTGRRAWETTYSQKPTTRPCPTHGGSSTRRTSSLGFPASWGIAMWADAFRLKRTEPSRLTVRTSAHCSFHNVYVTILHKALRGPADLLGQGSEGHPVEGRGKDIYWCFCIPQEVSVACTRGLHYSSETLPSMSANPCTQVQDKHVQ
jgi:hypothetical protein